MSGKKKKFIIKPSTDPSCTSNVKSYNIAHCSSGTPVTKINIASNVSPSFFDQYNELLQKTAEFQELFQQKIQEFEQRLQDIIDSGFDLSILDNYVTKSSFSEIEGIVTDINTRLSITETEISLKADKTVVDLLSGSITELESELTVQAGLIATKVSQTEFNQLDELVETLQTQIVQTASQIALKADQSLVDELGNIVSQHSAELTIQADQIATKVSQSAFDTLEGTVTNLQTQIIQTAEQIELKADKTIVDQLSGTVTELESELIIQADQIASKVSKSEFDTLEGTVVDLQTTITQTADQIALKADKTTVDQLNDAVTELESELTIQAGQIATKVSQSTFDALEGVVTNLQTQIIQTSEQIELKADKTVVDDLEGRVTEAESQLVIQADQISSKVSQTEFSNLSDYVESLETQITQTAESINLKADKTVVDELEDRLIEAEAELDIQADRISTKVSYTEFDTLTGEVNNLQTQIIQTASEIALKADKSVVDDLTGVVSEHSSQLSIQADQISTKVSQTDFDSLSDTVTGLTTATVTMVTVIDQMAGQIALKADKSVVDNIENRITEAEAELIVQAGQISLKASQTDLDNLEDRVSTAEAELIVQAGEISTKVSQSDFDTLEGTVTDLQTTVNQTASQIALKADKTVVDDLSDTVDAHSAQLTIQADEIASKVSQTTYNNFVNNTNNAISDLSSRVTTAETNITQNANEIVLKADKTVVDELEDRVTSAEAQIVVQAGQISLKASKEEVDDLTDRVTSAESTLVVHANQIATKVSESDFEDLEGRVTDAESTITQHANQIALKVNQTDFNTLSGRVTSAESNITILGSQIASKVSQTVFDELEDRVTSAESSITQNANQIALKVSQTDFNGENIVSLINLEPSNVKIQAKNIQLNGAVTFSSFDSNLQSDFTSLQNNATTVAQIQNYIDNVLPGQLQDLENALDGLSEQHFYTYDPDDSLPPTSDWIDNDEQDDHLGDMWYNTENGKTFRYVKDGSDYFWQEVVNTDLQAALQLASQAKDTADSKRRIFTVTPFPPYDIGDIWVQGPSGDIMRATVARTTAESYNSADWQKASKYTDDTTANTAISRLNNLVNKNLLNANDRKRIELEMLELASEKLRIDALVSQYGITGSVVTNYNTNYTTLYNDFNTIVNTSTETFSPPSNFNTHINDYKSSRNLLINAIENARKNKVDELEGEISDIWEEVDTTSSEFQDLVSNLRSLAFQDITDVAIGGQTLIQGGLINTVLLDANAIKSNIINAAYINTLQLDAAAIKTGTIDSARINASQILLNAGGVTNTQLNQALNDINIGSYNLLSGGAEATIGPSSNAYTSKLFEIEGYLQTSTQYTLSIEKSEIMSGTSVTAMTAAAYNGSNAVILGDIPISSTEKQKLTFTTPSSFAGNQTYNLIIYAGPAGSSNNREIKLTRVKLEKGNKATDWSMSATDLKRSILVGGTNLLHSSNVVKTNTNYNIANYALADTLQPNEEVCVTIWGELGSDRTQWGLYNSGGSVLIGYITKSDEVSPGIFRKAFKWKIYNSGITASNTSLWIYQNPNNGTTSSTIYKIKLERGNQGTDWTPSEKDFFDNIKVGGNTNLLDNSEEERGGTGRFYELGVRSALQNYVGKDICVSFDIKVTIPASISVYAYQESGISIDVPGGSPKIVQATTNWQRFSFVTKVKNWGQISGSSNGSIAFYDPNNSSNIITIRRIRISLGNILSDDWIPSTNDILSKTAKLVTLSGSTQIIRIDNDGNKIPSTSFTVTGIAQNTNITSWQYSVNGGSFSTTVPTGVSRSGETVTINPNTVTFKTLSIRASDGTNSDTYTIAVVSDGQAPYLECWGTSSGASPLKGGVWKNGEVITTTNTRGHRVVVLDKDFNLVSQQGFDTYLGGTNITNLVNYVEGLTDKIVCIYSYDAIAESGPLRDLFVNLGGKPGKPIQYYRQPYAIIGMSKDADGNWPLKPGEAAESYSLTISTSVNVIAYRGGKGIIGGGAVGRDGQDGIDGQDGYTVILENEAHTFAGNTNSAIAGSTTVNVISYKGANPITPTSITVGTMPTGMTASVSGDVITFNVTSSMTSPSGTVPINIVIDGKTFPRQFSYAISFKGNDGVSIVTVDVEFAKNTNPSTPPASGWTTTAPTLGTGEQLWTRTKTYYSNSNTTTSTPANITPKDGISITNVVEEYYLSTSKTTQTGGSWVTTPPAWQPGKYLWSRLKIIYSNSTTSYTTPVVSSEWEAIDSIVIGGTNLLRVTELYNHNIGDMSGKTYPNGYVDSTTRVRTVLLDMSYGNTYCITIPSDYDISIQEYNSSNVWIKDNTWLPKNGNNPVLFSPTSSNCAKCVVLFRKTNNGTITVNEIRNAKIKIERGNKATDWSPNPDDLRESAIAAIQIGGENLISNSEALAMFNTNIGTGVAVTMSDETIPYRRVTPDSDKNVSLYGANFSYIAGKVYISSVDVRHSHSSNVTFRIRFEADVNTMTETSVPPNTWTRIYSKPFTPSSNVTTNIILSTAGATGLVIDYRRVQVELGTIATDWKPALSDKIEVAKLGSTIMQGGYLRNTLIDTDNLIVRGPSGVGNTTLISGGKIRTEHIDVDSIIVSGNAVTNAQLTDALNNIKVGGINLLDNSETLFLSPASSGSGTAVLMNDESIPYRRVTPNIDKAASVVGASIAYSAGKTYIASVDVRHSHSSNVNVRLRFLADVNSMQETSVPPNVWVRITSKAHLFASNSSSNLGLNTSGAVGVPLDYRRIQIEEGTVSTNWKPSLTDTEVKIAAAQSAANNANALLADMALDSKLTPVEKKQVKVEWDAIVSEKTKNESQADAFSVSKTAYQNAYNNLSSYITPLLSNLSTTSDINAATFRNTFKAYYDARTDLLNAIAAKVKQLADAAQETADNIKVGGENLLNNSDIERTLTSGGTLDLPRIQFKKDEYIAWGVDVNLTDDDSTNQLLMMQEWETETTHIRRSTEWVLENKEQGGWVRYSGVYKMKQDGWLSIGLRGYGVTQVKFKNIKIERGNKPTDWTPSLSDTQTKINAAQTAADNAQAAANNALGIANSKVTTYTSPPSSYKAGEFMRLFSNYTTGGKTFYSGKIYVANTNNTGGFNASHWDDALNVGGVNLVLDSDVPIPSTTNTLLGKYNLVKALESGKTYTVTIKGSGTSFVIRDDNGVNTLGTTQSLGGGLYRLIFGYGGSWAGNTKVFSVYNTAGGSASVTWIKLEEGSSVSNEWSPAPQEMEYLKNALQKSTIISGGLTLGTVIGVRDSSSVVRAYMNGDDSNPITFAAGVDNFASIGGAETQKIALYKDGSGFLASGNISWDTIGNLIVKGRVEAEEGYFKNGDIEDVIISNADIENVTINNADIENATINSSVIGGFHVSSNTLTNPDFTARILFESAGASSDFIRLNESSISPLIAVRTDSASRKGVEIQTYASGATGLYIISNDVTDSSYAIHSAGGHMFYQRSGETWNAPGLLAAFWVQINNTSASLSNIWKITPLTISLHSWNSSTQVCRINHNLGHIEYVVQINTNSAGGWTKTLNRQNTYFEFDMDGMNNNNTTLQILMIGRNKL